MAVDLERMLICDCGGSMRIDGAKLGAGLDGEAPKVHRQLCRAELAAFEDRLADGAPLLVACTQEAPLFAEVAEEAGFEAGLGFVNIRERAGWSGQGVDATAKIAALLADAHLPLRPAEMRSIDSDGLCLVLGAGEVAFDAARRLSDHLAVTLILTGDVEEVVLPAVLDFAIYQGRIVAATGSFGSFELVVDGYAALEPSARAGPVFGPGRDGVALPATVLVDVRGAGALLGSGVPRDGYLRADPARPAEVMRVLLEASDLVGSFEKPLHVSYDSGICAHSRSRIVGCSNCIDLCPAGAITSDGDGIAIHSGICGGCGACAGHCPTGAITYRTPTAADLVRRIGALAAGFSRSGGTDPVLLLHDEIYGMEVITLMARLGDGLPPNVLPLAVYSIDSIGHELLAASLAAGFVQVNILANPATADHRAGLLAEISLMAQILAGLGEGGSARIRLIDEADPDRIGAALYAAEYGPPLARSPIQGLGGKRDLARLGIRALAGQSPPAEPIPLSAPAPYGRITVDTSGCTLCLACVSACPAGALSDNEDKPMVRLVEAACVQCGICAATCPESVIRLEPRLDLSPAALQPFTLHEEEPFACIRCGKAFASRSTIERISEQLAGKHHMYLDDARIRMLQMCEDCRVKDRLGSGTDPMAMGERPRIRTTDDYRRAEEAGLSVDDFLKES